MALSSAKHEPFYVTTGTGKDKISTDELAQATAAWVDSKANGCERYLGDPALAPLIYQLQQMQDEIDYLRTEISANKDKATFPGFGTSNSTALVGDTTTISGAQASAITANTAKTSMTLGTTGSTALAGDTRIPAFTADDTSVANTTKSTAITFGNFTTTGSGKTLAYTLPITVVETTVVTGAKPLTTTLTKTATLTLT
jgi:hypothetical protein